MGKQLRNATVIVVGGVLLFLASRNGRLVPARPPDEAYRVHHPDGFSLVCPDNWDARSRPSGIVVSPRTKIVARSQTSISVEELDEFYSSEDSQTVEFPGAPATLSIVKRKGTFDDPPNYSYRIQFDRGGRKFLLQYQLAENRNDVPAEVLPYLDSFEIDEKPTRL